MTANAKSNQPMKKIIRQIQAVLSAGVVATICLFAAVRGHAAVSLSESGSAPTPGANDISQTSTTGNTANPNSKNYFSNDTVSSKAVPPGEKFTTANNGTSYTMTDIYVQTGNGSGNSIGGSTAWTLYLYSVSGSTATLIASYPGLTTGVTFNNGDWLHFGSLAVGLSPNTTYAYAIYSGNSAYTGLENSSASLSGANAVLIATNNGAITTVTGFNGVFDIVLTPTSVSMSEQSSAPTPGANDISQTSTAGNTTNPNSKNYFSNNNPAPGEQFTTANSSAVSSYTLNNIYVQTGNGSGNSIGSSTPWTLYLYSVSGSAATLIATYPGLTTGSSFNSGDWLKFSSLSLTLSKNTTYAYAIYSGSSPYTGLENSSASLTGATADLIALGNGAITTVSGFNGVFDLGLTANYLTPNAPTGLSATAGASQVALSWTAPSSGPTPTGYNVYRSTISGSGYALLAAGSNVSGTSFTDTTANNGTTYYYVVTALNNGVESAQSGQASATPAAVMTITSAAASPASLTRYQGTLLTVTLTNGVPPFTVTVNAVSIGGGTVTLYTNAATGGFTNTVTPGTTTVAGGYLLPVSVSDSTTPTAQTASANISLTVTSSALTWNGNASGDWDTSTANWQGGLVYLQGDATRFDDTLTGTTNVNLTTTLSPGGITVSNTAGLASADYTFSGSGKFSGGMSLIKDGSGTLTLAETGGDNFTGGIAVSNGTIIVDNTGGSISGGATIASGGTMQVGNSDANGILPAGTVTDNGSIAFNRSDSALNVSSVIYGSGTVVNHGTGTVKLSGANIFSGGLAVSGGTLQVSGSGGNTGLGTGNTIVGAGASLVGTTADAFGYGGSAPGTISVLGGTITDLGTSSYRITLPNLTFMGGTLTRTSGNNGDGNGNFSFNGTGGNCSVTTLATNVTAVINAAKISFQQPTTFNVAAGTTSSGVDLLVSSVIVPYGSQPMTKSGGGVMALDANNTWNGWVAVSAGTLQLGTASDATRLTEPLGAGLVTNNATINFASSQGITVSNSINGTGVLTVSSGVNVLTGSSTYIGNTTVNGGSLAVNGALASGSVVTVTNATLGGTGMIGGATTLQTGAVLAAGNGGIGTLTFSGNLTLNAAATNNFTVTTAGGASNKVVVAGLLTPNSSVIRVITGAALQPGTNVLFTYGTVSGSFNSAVVFDVAPVHPAVVLDNGSGQISLVVPNSPPVAGSGFAMGATIGYPAAVKIIGGKYAPTDADGDALTVTSVGGATNGTVTTDGTNITYAATNGTMDSFTYTVSDPYGATASATVNVTINATGQGFNQLSAQLLGGNEVMKFAGIPNYPYALDWTTNLTPPVVWIPVVTNTAAANGFLIFTSTPSGGSDFYRTRYAP